MVKYSSLLRTTINYDHKKFYNVDTWLDSLVRLAASAKMASRLAGLRLRDFFRAAMAETSCSFLA
jgi:hypothetical protein